MARSLESALAEEAEEIRALLEGRQMKIPQPLGRERTASPAGIPKSPIRSMLDVDAPPPSLRHASIAGTNMGITRPSMLDPMAPMVRNRSVDYKGGSSSPSAAARRIMSPAAPGGLEDSYKFNMLPSSSEQALPLRVAQGDGFMGKSSKKSAKAMSSVFGRDSSKEARKGSLFPVKSASPGPQGRSKSPGGRNLNTNSMNLMTTPGKYISDSGQVIDMSSAYRRLSDAALLKSGSSLAKLPSRKGANVEMGEQLAPDGGVRLTKDYADPNDHEAAIDSSDEEMFSSDEEYDVTTKRGRERLRKGSNEPSGPRRGLKSLLSAVEEERKAVAIVMPYRSLLEPEVTVTGPSGESSASKSKRGIHPSTSFDQHSDISTPYDSDQEEMLTDIHRAQKLDINISAIHSTPSAHRSISQIIRGDFTALQKEAEKGLRRQRMYLVATDLSDEAAYALEWTIGTVLRDGDTLLAVYAVDEELGTGGEGSATAASHAHVISTRQHSVFHSEATNGADVVKDLGSLTKTLSHEASVHIPGASPDRNDTTSEVPVGPLASDPDIKNMDKAEKERYFAVQEVTDRCVRLLRKTRLQVRVVVEVFHCKSPKHMITEVIDFLTPTLVILGSRGRSALKGVLLGSFSNYLVTKSSVPVMVARKKLRKHSKSAGFRSQMRLSNMLSAAGAGNSFSRLEFAKIEKPMAHKSGGGSAGSGS